MLMFDSVQEDFGYWKARLFDADEATSVEAASRLVDVANRSRELRRDCTELLACRLERLRKDGNDLFFTLQAVSDLSRGIVSSSESLMQAILKVPVKDSYALNMATGILLYEMSQGFIKPNHALEQRVWDMATRVARDCKGDAHRNAVRILELAQANSSWRPEFGESAQALSSP
jgi:hypothetical protein